MPPRRRLRSPSSSPETRETRSGGKRKRISEPEEAPKRLRASDRVRDSSTPRRVTRASVTASPAGTPSRRTTRSSAVTSPVEAPSSRQTARRSAPLPRKATRRVSYAVDDYESDEDEYLQEVRSPVKASSKASGSGTRQMARRSAPLPHKPGPSRAPRVSYAVDDDEYEEDEEEPTPDSSPPIDTPSESPAPRVRQTAKRSAPLPRKSPRKSASAHAAPVSYVVVDDDSEPDAPPPPRRRAYDADDNESYLPQGQSQSLPSQSSTSQSPARARRTIVPKATPKAPEPESPRQQQQRVPVVEIPRRQTAKRTGGAPLPRKPPVPSKPPTSAADPKIGEAGPGPRTVRARQEAAERSLGPVPQLSQSVFKPFVSRELSEQQEQGDDQISNFSSPSLEPELQAESSLKTVHHGKVRFVDGEEVLVASDSEGDGRSNTQDTDMAEQQLATASTATDNAAVSAEVERLKAQLQDRDEALRKMEERAEEAEAEAGAAHLMAQDKEGEVEAAKKAADATVEAAKKEAEALVAAAKKGEAAALAALEEARQSTAIPAAAPADPNRPVDEQIKERDDVITDLRKRIKNLNSALKSCKGDLAFFQEQYQIASTSAVEEVKKANTLEEQVGRLREQLKFGLKQRELFNAAAAKQRDDELREAQRKLNLLLEQSRRTDDTIRRKAAAHGRLIKENRELEAELHKLRGRADGLSKRNDELSERCALLRGRLMGAFDPVDSGEDDNDDDSTDDDSDAPSRNQASKRAPPPVPALNMFASMPAFAPDDKPTPPVVPVATLADGGMEAYRCKWAMEGTNTFCPEIFQTRDELETHGLGHMPLQGGQ